MSTIVKLNENQLKTLIKNVLNEVWNNKYNIPYNKQLFLCEEILKSIDESRGIPSGMDYEVQELTKEVTNDFIDKLTKINDAKETPSYVDTFKHYLKPIMGNNIVEFHSSFTGQIFGRDVQVNYKIIMFKDKIVYNQFGNEYLCHASFTAKGRVYDLQYQSIGDEIIYSQIPSKIQHESLHFYQSIHNPHGRVIYGKNTKPYEEAEKILLSRGSETTKEELTVSEVIYGANNFEPSAYANELYAQIMQCQTNNQFDFDNVVNNSNAMEQLIVFKNALDELIANRQNPTYIEQCRKMGTKIGTLISKGKKFYKMFQDCYRRAKIQAKEAKGLNF